MSIPTYYEQPVPSPQNPPASQIEQLVQMRQNLINALLIDSVNPPATHTIDGISVSATEWRKSLLDQINGINTLITALNPPEIVSVIM